MLEHSLQDNPEDIVRGNDSRIAYLINHDQEYLSKLDEAIKNSKNGILDDTLPEVKFEKDDLYYSIHKADIKVNGYRQENGKWLVHARLSDIYDFTEFMTVKKNKKGELEWDIRPGTVANDVGVVSQSLGGINPYRVTVDFYTTR